MSSSGSAPLSSLLSGASHGLLRPVKLLDWQCFYVLLGCSCKKFEMIVGTVESFKPFPLAWVFVRLCMGWIITRVRLNSVRLILSIQIPINIAPEGRRSWYVASTQKFSSWMDGRQLFAFLRACLVLPCCLFVWPPHNTAEYTFFLPSWLVVKLAIRHGELAASTGHPSPAFPFVVSRAGFPLWPAPLLRSVPVPPHLAQFWPVGARPVVHFPPVVHACPHKLLSVCLCLCPCWVVFVSVSVFVSRCMSDFVSPCVCMTQAILAQAILVQPFLHKSGEDLLPLPQQAPTSGRFLSRVQSFYGYLLQYDPWDVATTGSARDCFAALRTYYYNCTKPAGLAPCNCIRRGHGRSSCDRQLCCRWFLLTHCFPIEGGARPPRKAYLGARRLRGFPRYARTGRADVGQPTEGACNQKGTWSAARQCFGASQNVSAIQDPCWEASFCHRKGPCGCKGCCAKRHAGRRGCQKQKCSVSKKTSANKIALLPRAPLPPCSITRWWQESSRCFSRQACPSHSYRLWWLLLAWNCHCLHPRQILLAWWVQLQLPSLHPHQHCLLHKPKLHHLLLSSLARILWSSRESLPLGRALSPVQYWSTGSSLRRHRTRQTTTHHNHSRIDRSPGALDTVCLPRRHAQRQALSPLQNPSPVGGQTRVDLATLAFFPCFIGFFGPLKGAKAGPFGNFFWIGLVAFWGQCPRSTGV